MEPRLPIGRMRNDGFDPGNLFRESLGIFINTWYFANALDAAGKAVKYGKLSDGFSLNLFTDHQMTKTVDTKTLFIGQLTGNLLR